MYYQPGSGDPFAGLFVYIRIQEGNIMAYDYEWFKREVLSMTRIDLNSYKEKQMKRRIDTLIAKNNIVGYDKYVEALRNDRNKFDEFVNYLTINVSEFYRNPDQWGILDKEVFPELIDKFGRHLSVWSAACSTGDESYSLVMALSAHLPLSDIRITATDIDKQVLAKAKVGLYAEKSIESVPAVMKQKYFSQIGPSFQISDEVKRCVTYKEHNLLKDPYPTGQNLIVCRNVLIYFTDEAKDDIFRKFYNSLTNGGVLFIGNTEQIINYREMGFERESSFFYRKPER